MNAIVEQLLESPVLPDIVEQLQARLAEEQVRRQKFYEEITEEQKAEFINGQIIMHSPATVRHLAARERLSRLLSVFVDLHDLGRVYGEKALCVFPRNDYEPDVCFFRSAKARGFLPAQIKLPPPDFIAEILSQSTEAKDRGEKFEDYAAHGVQEYWIVDPDREVLETYIARDGRYHLAQKSGTGEVSSAVVTGFCVPVRALFDAEANLRVLRDLLGPGIAGK